MTENAYILTGSFLVECIPPANKISEKLLKNIIIENRQSDIDVYFTHHFDKKLLEITKKERWVYNIIRAMALVGGYDKDYNDPIEAVIDLANQKCEIYENVIIINGSNRFEGKKFRKDNIHVKPSKEALEFLLNC